MRVVLAYLLIWLLVTSVRPAREIVARQFSRLPGAMRGRFWQGALAGVILVAVNGTLLLWIGAVTVSPSYRVSAGAILLAVAFAALVAATEEMLVRGLLLTRLREISTTAVAVIATAAIFALMHVGRGDFSIPTTTQYFVDGLLLAWMTLVTSDIWMATGFHFAKNLGVYFLFGGSRHLLPPFLTSPPPVPWADVLSYALILPLAWVLLSGRIRA